MSSTEAAVAVVEDPPPKLESWSVVCRQLYTPLERIRLVGGNPREPTVSIYLFFLNKLITGELFQTPQDWQDLQRRLRAHGYSDDLTGLKQTMLLPEGRQQDHQDNDVPTTEQTTTTNGTAASTRAGTRTAGQKRSVMDCHGTNTTENGNPQDKPNNPADDYENWRKKLKLTLHDRLRASANRLVHDRKAFPKRRLLRNLHSTLHRNDAHQNLYSLDNPVPCDGNNAPTGTAVVIPHDPGEANTMAESMATAPDGGSIRRKEQMQLESAVHAALREFQARLRESSLGKAASSATTRNDMPSLAVHNHRDETVPTNVVAMNQGGLAAVTTWDTTMLLPMADTRKSAPVASLPKEFREPFSMDMTKPGYGVIPSDEERTQGMFVGDTTTTPTPTTVSTTTNTTLNNITQNFSHDDNVVLVTPEKSVMTIDHHSTSLSSDEQEDVSVLPHPMDVGNTATVVSTEPKETLLEMEDSPLNRQDQKEGEEAELSSTIISAVAYNTPTTATSTTAVVVPDVSSPHQGGVIRNLIISMVVWSFSLHVFLWTLLETTDHQFWRTMMNQQPYNIPLRIRLSMEAVRQPRVHSFATIAEPNPHHGPWLARQEGDASFSAKAMMSPHQTDRSKPIWKTTINISYIQEQ